MRDPVTGFVYPAIWVERCTDPVHLRLVEQGLAVLTSSGTVIRRGFTTGTTAAAACKAAILSLRTDLLYVTVTIPCGLTVLVAVTAHAGTATCTKFSGDYTEDVTAGLCFVAEAFPEKEKLELIPGEGIGHFGRSTPRYPKETPAISTSALDCIVRSMDEAIHELNLTGVSVKLTVPDGERVAGMTLNSRVGVENGISILGTTGLVDPWDDHLEESVMEQIAAAKNPVLTTGRV